MFAAGDLSDALTVPELTSKEILAMNRKRIVTITLPNLIPITDFPPHEMFVVNCSIGMFFQNFRGFY